MTIGSVSPGQIWIQISKYQRQIHLLIVIVLAAYLLAYAADLTWRLIPKPDAANSQQSHSLNASNSKSSSASQKANLAAIKRLNLFGDLAAKPAVVQETVTDAPETRLNLTLTGVVATNEPSIAAAIIENRGMQNTYGIDDEIEGTNATLKQVFADRVIIQNGLRNETLMLDGVDYNKSVEQPKTARVEVDDRSDVEENEQFKMLSQEAAQSTRELQQSPANFTDYINISPHSEDGQLVGYRIAPGKNPKLFKEAGFAAGDIVTEINGLDLTDPQQALEAMAELRTTQALQLTINREQQLLTLYLEFPQGNDEQDI